MPELDLFLDITAPNGRQYKQPTGLFIDNEFVKSTSGQTIASIDPAYVNYENFIGNHLCAELTPTTEQPVKSPLSTQSVPRMSIKQSMPPKLP